MLGNGRPFVVEVLEAKEPPSREVIQIALDFVSSGSGLNVDNDVDVLILEEVRTSIHALYHENCLCCLIL
jgi:hypothetical protein